MTNVPLIEIERLEQLIENEARSCSMGFGCVMPEYVYKMWGGSVAIEEIALAMSIFRQAR